MWNRNWSGTLMKKAENKMNFKQGIIKNGNYVLFSLKVTEILNSTNKRGRRKAWERQEKSKFLHYQVDRKVESPLESLKTEAVHSWGGGRERGRGRDSGCNMAEI